MITLSDKNKEFLRLLIEEKKTYNEISDYLKLRKDYVKTKVHRLKNKKIIEKLGKLWHLTDIGKALYTNSRALERLTTKKSQSLNIHFHKIKAKVIKKKWKPNEDTIENVETMLTFRNYPEYNIKVSQLNNTKIIIFKNLFGTEIRATSQHILIKVPKIHAKSLDHCLKESENYFNKILPKVEKFFGITLDNKFINQFWLSTRHIEYIHHRLARIHKKYDCMDIEILDKKTGERLLYFDKSGGKINAETESIRKGVEVAYNLEQFDRDITDGYSMSHNYKNIYKLENDTNNIKSNLEHISSILLQTSNQISEIVRTESLLNKNIEKHLELVMGATKIINQGQKELNRQKQKIKQQKTQKKIQDYYKER